MAVARVCDICGKTTTKYFYSISVEKCLFFKHDRENCIDYSDKSNYELCPECMNKFKNFIVSNKKE